MPRRGTETPAEVVDVELPDDGPPALAMVPAQVGRYRSTSAVLAARRDTEPPLVEPSRCGKRPGRINLKAVGEALAERGLDPTEAIIDILRPLDPETGLPLPCKLDADVQARILNELLQYTQPKLKSVEIRAKVAATAFDVNDEQAKRIASEFLAAVANAAAGSA